MILHPATNDDRLLVDLTKALHMYLPSAGVPEALVLDDNRNSLGRYRRFDRPF